MKTPAAVVLGLAVAFGGVSVTEPAVAKTCATYKKNKANRGTAYGAVGGAVLGNVVAARGNKTEGTLLGGAVGAVVGHQIAKNNAKCHYPKKKRHYRR